MCSLDDIIKLEQRLYNDISDYYKIDNILIYSDDQLSIKINGHDYMLYKIIKQINNYIESKNRT